MPTSPDYSRFVRLILQAHRARRLLLWARSRSDWAPPPTCSAPPKAAEGASPRTVEWYRMILVRAVRRFGEARPVDAIPAAELRAWLLELRGSLASESIAGYVRGLKVFGNWCAAEELAAAGGFRALRRPKVQATRPSRPSVTTVASMSWRPTGS